MTTSGVYEIELTLNGLLEQAYDNLQIGQDGETLDGNFYNRARHTLNVMLKTWEAQGIHLWTMQEGVLFLRIGQSEYDFGNPSTHLANVYHTTHATLGHTIGATLIEVESTFGMEIGNPIGIAGSDNDLQWFTIDSFVPDTSVTLSSPLTHATLQHAVIYHYPDDFKPVARVLSVRRKEGSTYEIPIEFVSRETYMSLPNKNTRGYPIQAYYSREEPRGKMYIWNAPSSSVPVVPFTYERKVQIMTEADQTFDFPEYWFEAIIYNLAVRLIPKYGCAPTRSALLAGLAKQSLDDCLGFDTDLYPITLNLSRY